MFLHFLHLLSFKIREILSHEILAGEILSLERFCPGEILSRRAIVRRDFVARDFDRRDFVVAPLFITQYIKSGGFRVRTISSKFERFLDILVG